MVDLFEVRRQDRLVPLLTREPQVVLKDLLTIFLGWLFDADVRLDVNLRGLLVSGNFQEPRAGIDGEGLDPWRGGQDPCLFQSRSGERYTRTIENSDAEEKIFSSLPP